MYTGWQDGLKCFARSFAVRFVGKCEMFESHTSRLHIRNKEINLATSVCYVIPFTLPLGQWLSESLTDTKSGTWDCWDLLKSWETPVIGQICGKVAVIGQNCESHQIRGDWLNSRELATSRNPGGTDQR